MASQWNDEFFSQFTPVVRDNRNLRGGDDTERLVVLRATDGEFVHANDRQIHMPELELYMRHDLVPKATEVVTEADGQHPRHSTDNGGFDGSGLGLVTTDALLIHANQTDLEASQFVTSSSRQLPELVPHCLQSLGSALDVPVSQDFQPQHAQQNLQHASLLQQVNEEQHLQHHLEQHHHQQQESHSSPADLLLPQAIEFDSPNTHPLAESGICHGPTTPSLHLPPQQNLQEQQPVSANSQPSVTQPQMQCQDVHPLSSFGLHESIIGASSLHPKLTSLVSDQNPRSEDGNTSFSSPSTTLSFLHTSPPLQLITTADMMRTETDQVSVSPQSDTVSPVLSSSSDGKAKKRKLTNKASGDMVWVNSKSLESRQRNRHATQILIEIVCNPKWQEKLNSSTTKKKTVWREIGEEFSSHGYFLENPGKKCFQKWRNLERSFREYELSKKTPSSVPKCRPDFYEELQPFLKEKLSVECYFDEKGDKPGGIVDERLMEKYVDLDCTSSGKDVSVVEMSNQQGNSNGDCFKNTVIVSSVRDSKLKPGCGSSGERLTWNEGEKPPDRVKRKVPTTSAGHNQLTASLVESMGLQRKDLAEISSALTSIKELLVEQKREREATNEESKLRFMELKAMIDRNQREKMAFMYDFLKSIKFNQNPLNGEKS